MNPALKSSSMTGAMKRENVVERYAGEVTGYCCDETDEDREDNGPKVEELVAVQKNQNDQKDDYGQTACNNRSEIMYHLRIFSDIMNSSCGFMPSMKAPA